MHGNGHVIPSTPIAVDMWNIKLCPQARIFFFLSHFHADHIVGLNSSWKHTIYTSPITAKFLINNIKINPFLVKSLEIGEDHLISLDEEGQEMVTVTLLMPITVQVLCLFPTRDDAIESVLSQLNVCLVQSERVFIGLDSLGKEELLQRIAKERQCKINVYPGRKNIMDILGMSDIVTTDKNCTKIFIVPTNQISGKNIEKWNNEKKTHAIIATARFCGFKFKPFSKFNNIHVVPFSNHSSYYELKEFVKLVRPRAIIPIVNKHAKGLFGADISDRADMSVFQQFLREPISHECIIPESVKRTMNDLEAKYSESLPTKKRKIARPQVRPWRRPPAVGVRYIVSEDSETDSDPDAVHIEFEDFADEDITEYSSQESKDSELEESDCVWEITHLTGKGPPTVYYVKES
ncbi:5' exonuclease Apollo [Caerostris extrusa]|uniref:5' exonuclease Apollo n=1 Tax=Caerostris extrusa TaxID=172846 RepID=A0AAV4P625_CAEEX|nr:5' exonuclease Apollo [Caerostris extrusa]